ncbi:hypothetical protein JCM19235_23 [Vibrio maritimus]|uniref:Uncharacterized protein n=1 Tax=Vibrio maritimus TaxID=990268 RepID=A0A090S6U1_9VIBR|nr:hypothetical protein JCM19235_23 [Vibrio maritimus]
MIYGANSSISEGKRLPFYLFGSDLVVKIVDGGELTKPKPLLNNVF